MSRIPLIILLFSSLSACKKLNSEQIFLSNSCGECETVVEEQLLLIDGIYFVDFDAENDFVKFHFDKNNAKLEAESWLKSNGLLPASDTSVFIYPKCCPVMENPSQNGEE